MELEFALVVSACIFSRAFLTPVIESLLLLQAKKDHEFGVNDLETFGLLMEAFGTIFYCVLGGYMIAWNEAMPYVFFWLIAATGAVTFIAGAIYPISSDEIDDRYAVMPVKQRVTQKIALFTEAISLPEVKNICIFIAITALCAPNLEEFLIYYNEMMMVTPLYEGWCCVVLFMTGAIIFLMYNSYVASKVEVHATQCVAILFRVISALFFAYDVAGFYPAGKTLMIQSFAVRSFVDAFLYLPCIILFSKMVPHHIEGMMIGFIWSIIKLNLDVFGRLITVGLNLRFKVQGEMMSPMAAEATVHAAQA